MRGEPPPMENHGRDLSHERPSPNTVGLLRDRPLTFRDLQEEQREWVAHNFPGRESWNPLLGIGEEVGELMHAHLKGHQGIRGTVEEHRAKGRDAVGDILIYLADYCSAMGFDLQQCVEETWAKVKRRDWRANPVDAHKGNE